MRKCPRSRKGVLVRSWVVVVDGDEGCGEFLVVVVFGGGGDEGAFLDHVEEEAVEEDETRRSSW